MSEQERKGEQASPLPLYVKVELDAVYKVLADPTRLEMVRMLGDVGGLCCRIVPGPSSEGDTRYGLCVQDFVAHLHLPQSTVSHHLSLLRKVGLVQNLKKGLWVYYYRDEVTIAAFKQAVQAL